jgi:hypothetical protein
MTTKNCYHYDLDATGTCPKCNVLIAVESGWDVSVRLGTQLEMIGSTAVQGYDPSIRDALALAFDIGSSAIQIVDVRATNNTWRREVNVTFRFIGSKIDIVATVGTTLTIVKTPARVEYTEEDAS